MKHESIQSIARRILTDAGGQRAKAIEALLQYISTRPSLTAKVTRMGADRLLSDVTTGDRAEFRKEYLEEKAATVRGSNHPFVKSPPRMNAGDKAAQERAKGLDGTFRDAVLDASYEIDGLIQPLRKWTGVVVMAHGRRTLPGAISAVASARFLMAIGEEAGDQVIGDAITPKRARELRDQADRLPA